MNCGSGLWQHGEWAKTSGHIWFLVQGALHRTCWGAWAVGAGRDTDKVKVPPCMLDHPFYSHA